MIKTRRDLEDRLRVLNKEIPDLRDALKSDQRGLSRMENERTDIATKLSNDITTRPAISDHALVRYLERACGWDMDRYRADILTPKTIAGIKAGAHSVKLNGMELVIKGNTVVTIQ